MECKFGSEIYELLGNIELIETLWNVNEFRDEKQARYKEELIETLWNVNTINGLSFRAA